MKEPRIVRTGEKAIVDFGGDLTSSAAGEARSRLVALAGEGVKQMVFDLASTGFVDSGGIGMLLSAHNTMSRAGGRIEVVKASNDVLALFKAMRLDRHFAVSGR